MEAITNAIDDIECYLNRAEIESHPRRSIEKKVMVQGKLSNERIKINLDEGEHYQYFSTVKLVRTDDERLYLVNLSPSSWRDFCDNGMISVPLSKCLIESNRRIIMKDVSRLSEIERKRYEQYKALPQN